MCGWRVFFYVVYFNIWVIVSVFIVNQCCIFKGWVNLFCYYFCFSSIVQNYIQFQVFIFVNDGQFNFCICIYVGYFGVQFCKVCQIFVINCNNDVFSLNIVFFCCRVWLYFIDKCVFVEFGVYGFSQVLVDIVINNVELVMMYFIVFNDLIYQVFYYVGWDCKIDIYVVIVWFEDSGVNVY